MNQDILLLTFLLLGLILGGLVGWLISKYRLAAQTVPKSDYEAQLQSLQQLQQEMAVLEHQLEQQNSQFQQLRQESQQSFENLANRIFEAKASTFSQQNQEQLHLLLQPLKERIREFEDGIEKKFLEDAREKLSLKLAIDQLKELNTQLSDDANRLVNALKGNNKTQGDWGEFQLELLLQKAGLSKEIHYFAQSSFKDEQGRDKRPDFVIQLPQGKHLIIDSKVSLVAYEKFFNAEEEAEQARHLKAHVQSIRQHVQQLSQKSYQQLYQINAPDYLLLYIPIEPAFSLALQEDHRLFLDALDKNIVLVTSSTLLATMRTVSYIWKQERQKRSVLEIARQSGLLYDRFVGFVEELQGIGQRLDQAKESYHQAMQKLTSGKRYGDTLVGRAQKIRELGAKASKNLPEELIDEAKEQDEPKPKALKDVTGHNRGEQ
ncbi:MAG: DNA recombination protein RmuC [Phaeodactylibacter sp.]|nr:DNA recombination protein RmuC [Phaeodactylibacter sp.]